MTEIKLEILQSSYWEHFKAAKDLARYLPTDNKKRVEVEKEINKIIEKL